MPSPAHLAAAAAMLVLLSSSVAAADDEPSPPQKAVALGAYRCVVGEHLGVEDADAHTSTELVCSELARQHAPPGEYAVRFGKLGSRILLTLGTASRADERSVFLQSIEEVTVAAPRLVGALVAHVSLDETQNVDNVVSAESRKPKTKAGSTGVYVGLVGMTAAGVAPGASAGGEFAVRYRMKSVALAGSFRAGGIGSGDHKVAFVGVDLGARFYLSDADVAGFVGGGLGLSYLAANSGSSYSDPDGSGFGANVEVGVELFRSSATAAGLSLRADAPFYALRGKSYGYESYESGGYTITNKELYVVPLSLNFGFTFR